MTPSEKSLGQIIENCPVRLGRIGNLAMFSFRQADGLQAVAAISFIFPSPVSEPEENSVLTSNKFISKYIC